MITEINGTISDISTMLLSSERYALGRKTYIVALTCSFIRRNMHFLTENDKKVMIRDIEECENYGDWFDKEEWMKLLNELKEKKGK